MEDITLRCTRARLASGITFGAFSLLFVTVAGTPTAHSQLLGSVMVILCLVLAVRGIRGGYVRVTRSGLTVRTIYRTRTFAWEDVTSVQPITLVQGATLVYPVLTLRSGKKFRMKEFLVQKRTFTNQDSPNPVSAAISAINDALMHHAQETHT